MSLEVSFSRINTIGKQSLSFFLIWSGQEGCTRIFKDEQQALIVRFPQRQQQKNQDYPMLDLLWASTVSETIIMLFTSVGVGRWTYPSSRSNQSLCEHRLFATLLRCRTERSCAKVTKTEGFQPRTASIKMFSLIKTMEFSHSSMATSGSRMTLQMHWCWML